MVRPRDTGGAEVIQPRSEPKIPPAARFPVPNLPRRNFLAAAAAAPAFRPAAAVAVPKLGYDNFALRAFGWKAPRLIEYAAETKCQSLLISDLDAFDSLETDHLKRLRAQAEAAGVGLHLGTWSICPTSTAFRKNRGTAAEHLALGLKAAAALGSPVLRVVLGQGNDRKTPGGIRARIKDTVAVCQGAKGLATDLRVKIAVENHAGDLRARELADLIDAAGPEFVGANLDSGNAMWTQEDPLASLEILGKLALSTSLRDGVAWETPKGAAVQWTAMGEGSIDWQAYFQRFVELCPGVPVHIETISGFNRDFNFLERGFWKDFGEQPADELAGFVAFAKRGRPRAAWNPPAGANRQAAERDYQRGELERSLAHCRKVFAALK